MSSSSAFPYIGFGRSVGRALFGTIATLGLLLAFAHGALAQSIGELLDAEGRIRADAGPGTGVDAEGWQMTVDESGVPRFSPADAPAADAPSADAPSAAALPPLVPDDVYWDTRFGSAGVRGKIHTILVRGCDDVLVGGEFTSIGGIAARNVARWDGTRWHSLGEGIQNGVDGPVYAIALDDGDIWVGGRFDSAGTHWVGNLARFDGTTWQTTGALVDAFDEFGLPEFGRGTVYALEMTSGGLVVGGRFDDIVTPVVRNNQLEYDTLLITSNIALYTGTEWRAFGEGVYATSARIPGDVRTLEMGYDGLYVGGMFFRSGDQPLKSLARWDGRAWHDVGGGVSLAGDLDTARVHSLDVNGADVYIGGEFSTAGTTPAANVAVWSGRIGRWFTFGAGSATRVRSIDVDGSRLYASGDFTASNGPDPNNVAFWSDGAWHALGENSENGADSIIYAVEASDGLVYIGGDFRSAGSVAADGIAVRDLGMRTWRSLNVSTGSGSGGIQGVVYAVALTDDYLYVGGRFTTAGVIRTNSLARWHRSTGTWSSLGGGITIDPNVSTTLLPAVRAIAVDGNRVYVGGRFDFAGGVRANNIAVWDGSVWAPLGTGIGSNTGGGTYDSTSTVYAIKARSGVAYVGGEFIFAGGERANRIARWTVATSRWSTLAGGIGGSNFNTRVNAIALHGGDVYVGGVFPVAGNTRASNVARFDGTEWFELGRGVNNAVFALAADSSGIVYAGGNFTLADNNRVNNIVMWNGTTWLPLGEGFSRTVRALEVENDRLYAAGDFEGTGAEPARHIALWRNDRWESLGSGLQGQDASGFALAVDGADVFVGGLFAIAGGEPSLNVARWSKPDTTPVPAPIVSSVARSDANAVAGVSAAHRPNPAVDRGIFELRLQHSSSVRITLHDATGANAIPLWEGRLPAGRQEVQWDAERIPRGTWIYRIAVNDEVLTGLVVLR